MKYTGDGRQKTYDADATIAPHRFVGPGTTAGKAAPAVDPTVAIHGISNEWGCTVTDAEARNDVDVYYEDDCYLELGAAVTEGAILTCDAAGKGVPATDGDRGGAMALAAGESGELLKVRIIPGAPPYYVPAAP